MSQRTSGILLHPSSLCNAYPIGDLGPSAIAFVDFLVEAGQHWWQMLPIGPTGGGNSPYQSSSAFAGNPLLVSPERLIKQRYLSLQDITAPILSVSGSVNFIEAGQWKVSLLRNAFNNYLKQRHVGQQREFEAFKTAEAYWLQDYSLFMALQEREGTGDWTRWPPELRTRHTEALINAQDLLSSDIHYHEFIQWQFSLQWNELKDYCRAKGIRLIGDIPLFVAHHSADVWAHPELFKLNADGKSTVVAGVPPDYFSKTGQLWGLPVYRWEVLQAQHYCWWIERVRMSFSRFDINRLDHVIGFVQTYEVPAQETTALKGRYVLGGGVRLFRAIHEALGLMPFIADDLGDSTLGVVALLDQFHIPGIQVLQFEFEAYLNGNPSSHTPHPHETVIYTGTHDNDTSAGWYQKLPIVQREALWKKLTISKRGIVWAMIREAMASPSSMIMVSAQDLLGLGSEARMNTPGIAQGNWGWRLTTDALTKTLASDLRDMTMKYGRFIVDRDVHPSKLPEGDLKNEIAKRAYRMYELEGRKRGQTERLWLQAERELLREQTYDQ